MGRKGKKINPFAQKKRDRKEGNNNGRPDRRSEPYQEIVRENEAFIKYYKYQKICPDTEWESFLTAIKSNLPTTFRITAHKGEAQTLLDIIKSEFFAEYLRGAAEIECEDHAELPKPRSLPWYPNEYAWQLELTRKDIRRSEAFYKLHNFLIAETNAGAISRQEAVSMIPPIVLDVQPHHKVLDMCAAPGSKTAQLIEALHAGDDRIPPGFVVANDVDNNRCYMLVHQAKRLNSPCFLVTNHDSSFMPNFFMTNAAGEQEEIKFDRILCDVPCSGDGTMRKNPDIWLKWNNSQSSCLHGVQYRIAKRGAEMLTVGGRMVYSTCSLNPVENEAVLHRLIKECEGALEIVDAAHQVPGLKYFPGMTYWEPATKEIEFFKTFDDVPEKFHTIIRPQMFPPNPDETANYNLEKCLRVLPHLQNTGGFFVAVLEKKKLLPWEKSERIVRPAVVKPPPSTETTTSEEKASSPWGPQRKRRRLHGYKEDPYVFFTENEEVWTGIKSFYNLSDEFNPLCLLTRSFSGKKKNIYFCSERVRDLLLCNEHSIKIINTGVKTFVRCDNRNMKCAFRLANEGLPSIFYMIGESRQLNIMRSDLILLLQNTDPTKPPLLPLLSEETQSSLKDFAAGSCVLKYAERKLSISLVGWKGTSSLRAYTEANDTIHMLRLLGADISKYDTNKFQKDKDGRTENVEESDGILKTSNDADETEDVEEVKDGVDTEETEDIKEINKNGLENQPEITV